MRSIILSLAIFYNMTFRFNRHRGWDLFVIRLRLISHWFIITCHDRTVDYMMDAMVKEIQHEVDVEILGKLTEIANGETFN